MRGSMGEPGDGSLVYEPVRRADGSLDLEASLGEYESLLDAHLRRSWDLRLMRRRRHQLVALLLQQARDGWTTPGGA